jgi:hypothetical protein
MLAFKLGGGLGLRLRLLVKWLNRLSERMAEGESR